MGKEYSNQNLFGVTVTEQEEVDRLSTLDPRLGPNVNISGHVRMELVSHVRSGSQKLKIIMFS